MYPDNKVTPKYLTKDKKYIEKALVLVARRPFFISSRGFLKEIYKYQVLKLLFEMKQEELFQSIN